MTTHTNPALQRAWTIAGSGPLFEGDTDSRIRHHNGYSTVLVIGSRMMTTTSAYQLADSYARAILPDARLLDTGHGWDGRPQRRYWAPDTTDRPHH